MHIDYLKARQTQIDAEYQQVRRDLARAQEQIQRLTNQGILLEGKLQEIAYLIDQDTPAIPIEDILPPGATYEMVKKPKGKPRPSA